MLMEDDILVGCFCQGCCSATTFSLWALGDCIRRVEFLFKRCYQRLQDRINECSHRIVRIQSFDALRKYFEGHFKNIYCIQNSFFFSGNNQRRLTVFNMYMQYWQRLTWLTSTHTFKSFFWFNIVQEIHICEYVHIQNIAFIVPPVKVGRFSVKITYWWILHCVFAVRCFSKEPMDM